MVKGIGALGVKGVDTGCYNDLNRIYSVGNMFGLVDDNTYAQVNYKVQENNQFWSSLPGNMINGIGSDLRTTFNEQKARNFFFNPDASLQDNVDYFSSSTNTVMTVVAVTKMATTLGKAGTAGYTAYKTAMKNSSVLVADTGMGVTLNATSKVQIVADSLKEGLKAGYTAIKSPVTNGMAKPRELWGRQLKDEFTGNVIKRIKKNMKKNGYNMNEPIEVFEVNGRNIILDGHHRARAAGALGIEEVPIYKLVSKEELWNRWKVTPSQLEDQAAQAAGYQGRDWTTGFKVQ